MEIWILGKLRWKMFDSSSNTFFRNHLKVVQTVLEDVSKNFGRNKFINVKINNLKLTINPFDYYQHFNICYCRKILYRGLQSIRAYKH